MESPAEGGDLRLLDSWRLALVDPSNQHRVGDVAAILTANVTACIDESEPSGERQTPGAPRLDPGPQRGRRHVPADVVEHRQRELLAMALPDEFWGHSETQIDD